MSVSDDNKDEKRSRFRRKLADRLPLNETTDLTGASSQQPELRSPNDSGVAARMLSRHRRNIARQILTRMTRLEIDAARAQALADEPPTPARKQPKVG